LSEDNEWEPYTNGGWETAVGNNNRLESGTDMPGCDHLNRLITASASGVAPTYSHTSLAAAGLPDRAAILHILQLHHELW
jgi:hypothetical protein